MGEEPKFSAEVAEEQRPPSKIWSVEIQRDGDMVLDGDGEVRGHVNQADRLRGGVGGSRGGVEQDRRHGGAEESAVGSRRLGAERARR